MRASLVRAVILAAAVSLAITSTALAAKPEKVPFTSPDPATFAGGTGFCDFDIEVADSLNREFAVIFSYPDGSSLWRVAGSLEIDITNLENGKSITWNAGGPGVAAFDSQGGLTTFVGRGHFLAYGPYEPLQSSGVYDYTGNVDGLNGTYVGRRTDICAALS